MDFGAIFQVAPQATDTQADALARNGFAADTSDAALTPLVRSYEAAQIGHEVVKTPCNLLDTWFH